MSESTRKGGVQGVVDQIGFALAYLLPVVAYIWLACWIIGTGGVPAGVGFWVLNVLIAIGILFYVGPNFYGFVRYGSPSGEIRRTLQKYQQQGWNNDILLNVIYVSRGQNREAVARSLAATVAMLDKTKTNYRVDVVTDMPMHLKLGRTVHFYVVPEDYQTKHGAKFKARALQYATEQRRQEGRIGDDIWLLHLDEESVLTPGAVAGLGQFVRQHHTRTIGQGEIQYNQHDYGSSLVLAALDSVRTGDDVGKCRAQYRRAQQPAFGMIHGSFLLIPSGVEDEVGFDLGAEGSIAEDSFFALRALELGCKFEWITGVVGEQSAFSLGDAMRQRRRWFTGLMQLTRDEASSRWARLVLKLSLYLWATAWLLITIVAGILMSAPAIPTSTIIIGLVSVGALASVYSVGAYRNAVSAPLPAWRKLALVLSAALLAPLCGFFESLVAGAALVRPVARFEVIHK